MTTPVYLDHHATTPVDPDVLQEMLPWFTERPGNPHSRHHEHGWDAEAAVDLARTEIARLLNAADEAVVFTSGATEANNWALKGAARILPEGRRRILVSAIEHPCVLESARALAAEGFDVTELAVDAGGGVGPDKVAAELAKGDVGLVSVMLANNEIGAIQPVAGIARQCREAGAWMHCDAAQAAGRIPVDFERLGVDMLSLTAHKFYGPKGIGALILSERAMADLPPLLHGGGQQEGRRSGTVPTPLAVGFGAAARLAAESMAEDRRRIATLRNTLWAGLRETTEGVHLNGGEVMRLPGNLNFRIDGADADDVIREAPEIAVSTGSACSSVSSAPSHVLAAIGLTEAEIRSSIRIGIGRPTTEADIEIAIVALAEAIRKART
ncbi:cysteine desulfurase family protein [Minwuia thermotolerans]|uniref:Cysteine desulfurase n=1 Tax=Minwuia thermotolerans TaxID=2056226 RepID=A0A2M9G1B6_9PROT|nr:cysteine desulfurase family protein [Minwuia thermotolerans]PJK29464.1 IscS subfamily cysteine desulfurase [Minwuia thermotolerans]